MEIKKGELMDWFYCKPGSNGCSDNEGEIYIGPWVFEYGKYYDIADFPYNSYYYPNCDIQSVFNGKIIDVEKGFRKPEKCAEYIANCIQKELKNHIKLQKDSPPCEWITIETDFSK